MKTSVSELTTDTRLPNRRKAAAFTLLETMIGAVLLVIVFGALLVTMSYGFATIHASRESLRATQIILERMENVRLYNWNQLVGTLGGSNSFSGFFYPPGTNTSSSSLTYHGWIIVTNVTMNPMPSYAQNMRLVTVTLWWNSDGITRQRTMSTYVAQNGVENYVFTH